MNWWGRLINWLNGTEPVGGFHEAIIDPEEHLWRPLTERGPEDLPGYEHETMLKIAGHLDRKNGVARRILDLIVDFVYGEGVQVQASNPVLREWLDKHWEDPRNNWDFYGPKLLRILLRDGEVILPAGINPVDGMVHWGQMMSRQVKEIRTDPNDWRIVQWVEFRADNPEAPDVRPGITEHPGLGRYEGEVFFWRYGDVDGKRGVSYLYPLADFIDFFDQMAFNELERATLMRHILFLVTIQNKSENDLRQLARDPRYAAPKPGEVIIKNQNETWETLTPDLDTQDATNLLTFILKTLILGSAGIPEHWFGSGGDVNRAVGAVMDMPTIKMITRLQRLWQHYLTQMLRFVIDQAVEHGSLPERMVVHNSEGDPTDRTDNPHNMFEVIFPDIDTTDQLQASQTFVAVTNAVLALVEAHYLTKETGLRIIATVASQFGPEVDANRELEKIQEELEQQEEEPLTPEEQRAQLAQVLTPNGTQPPATAPGPPSSQVQSPRSSS